MSHRILVTLALVSMFLVACGRVDARRNPDGGLDITISLTEAEVNTLVTNALVQAGSPLLLNPQVDLQNGQIVVNGQYQRPDGSTVNGSITVVPSVQNGQVTAQITQANIEGWDATDARIAEFNQRLAQALALAAARSQGQVTVQSISISDTTLQIVVTVQRQQ